MKFQVKNLVRFDETSFSHEKYHFHSQKMSFSKKNRGFLFSEILEGFYITKSEPILVNFEQFQATLG